MKTLQYIFVLISLLLLSDSGFADEIPKQVVVEMRGERPQFEVLYVPPETSVVWVNRLSYPALVRFIDRAPVTVCKAPRRFIVEPAGIFTSEILSPGGVASICFLDPGFYAFEVVKVEQDFDSYLFGGAVSVAEE